MTMTRKGSHAALISALGRIARPLIRVCFRAGVSVGEIRAVLDHAAVREAEQYLMAAGKKPTYSNISIITGLARHTVRVLRESDDSRVPVPSDSQLDRAVRVLNGWHEDSDFLDRRGNPRELRVRGGARSFEVLAQRYAGGVGYSAVLGRLLETQAVEATAKDATGRTVRVRAVQSEPEPEVSKSRLFSEFGEVYGDALESFDSILSKPLAEHEDRVYSVATTISAPKVRMIGRLLRERSQATIASVDALLKRYELDSRAQMQTSANAESIYDVRVSLTTTLRARNPPVKTVSRSWRRSRAPSSSQDGS
jgi:hypothetical protein